MTNEPSVISVAGKGGAGKTSFVAMLMKNILEEKENFQEILLVDADPASNIPDIMGLSIDKTIGEILDEKKEVLEGKENKKDYLKNEVMEAISHAVGFDYLVMGRTTGEGCYCLLNSVLSRVLDNAVKLYDLVIIDFDAGLEHFNRKTDFNADQLIVVAEPSKMSFETARRINNLTGELNHNYSSKFIVGNRFAQEAESTIKDFARENQFFYLGNIPLDGELQLINLTGKTIFDLSLESPAYKMVSKVWPKIKEKMMETV